MIKLLSLLIIISFSIQLRAQDWDRAILTKHKVKEISVYYHLDSLGIEHLSQKYFLDENGLVTEEIDFFNKDGRVDTNRIITSYYDSSYRKIKETGIRGKEPINIEYSYFSNGKTSTTKIVTSTSRGPIEEYFKTYKKGKKIIEDRFSVIAILTKKITFPTKNGWIKKSYFQQGFNSKKKVHWILNYEEIGETDESGRPIKVTTTSQKGTCFLVKTFDYGNGLEKRVCIKHNCGNIFEECEYYQYTYR